MSTPVRFGLIGAGAIAQAYIQALRDLDEVTLVGVADVRRSVADSIAVAEHCKAWDSVDELLAECRCDAAIVCTPPNTHAAISRALLERSIHTLCEKPLCIRSSDAEQLVDLACRENVLFSMATKFRFVEDVIDGRSMVESGIVGDILLFENAFTARVDMSRRWNSKSDVSGGGVLIDNGTHSVDLIRFFLGPITAVQAFEGRRIQKIPVEDSAQLRVRTADHVICTIDLSWSLNKELETYIQIYGSQGTIRIGWQRSAFKQASSHDWTEFGSGYSKVQAFKKQIGNFCRAVRGEEALVVTPEDALASVRVIETAYQSMRQNTWVEVPPGPS